VDKLDVSSQPTGRRRRKMPFNGSFADKISKDDMPQLLDSLQRYAVRLEELKESAKEDGPAYAGKVSGMETMIQLTRVEIMRRAGMLGKVRITLDEDVNEVVEAWKTSAPCDNCGRRSEVIAFDNPMVEPESGPDELCRRCIDTIADLEFIED
jgi:hypothetical protein